MELTIKRSYDLPQTVTEQNIQRFEATEQVTIPPILREFYLKYHSLQLDGNFSFELNDSMKLVQGDDRLSYMVHETMLLDHIKDVREFEDGEGEDSYAAVFDKWWSGYIPVVAAMGDNGYFMAGTKPHNLDQIIFLSLHDDAAIVEVCSDIFELFNSVLTDYED